MPSLSPAAIEHVPICGHRIGTNVQGTSLSEVMPRRSLLSSPFLEYKKIWQRETILRTFIYFRLE